MGEKSQTDQSLFWKSSANQMQNLKTGKSLRKQTKLLAPATRQFTMNAVAAHNWPIRIKTKSSQFSEFHPSK